MKPYSVNWKSDFEIEAKRLQTIFGSELTEIHHIGSTSVYGLAAKPIIDMMPIVKDLTKVNAFDEKMMAIGYEAMGEFGIPGRRYFRKGANERTHHIHLFEKGSPHIKRHLAFRDFLREHPHFAKTYGDLKEDLVRKFPNDMEAYIAGKADFVRELEKKALEWYRKLN